MKTKYQLSQIAKRAVEKRLENNLSGLSPNEMDHLKNLIDEYYEAKHQLDFILDIPTIVYHTIIAFPLNSFTRFGDRNELTPEIKRNYINPAGIPFDIQALFASNDYHTLITEQDFIDFIIANPYGRNNFKKAQIVAGIQSEIKALTGFIATHKFIEKLYYKINTISLEVENSPF